MGDVTRMEAVPARPSTETIETLETLLEAAREGHVIGVCFAAVLQRRQFVIDVVGEAAHDPTFSRGMVLALGDELRDMVYRQANGFLGTTS